MYLFPKASQHIKHWLVPLLIVYASREVYSRKLQTSIHARAVPAAFAAGQDNDPRANDTSIFEYLDPIPLCARAPNEISCEPRREWNDYSVDPTTQRLYETLNPADRVTMYNDALFAGIILKGAMGMRRLLYKAYGWTLSTGC